MSQRVLRGSSDIDKFNDLLDSKLESFGKTLATKEDVEEIKKLFADIGNRLEYQERKIAALEKEGSDHEERIGKLENKVLGLIGKNYELENTLSNLIDKNAVLSSSVNFLKKQSDLV